MESSSNKNVPVVKWFVSALIISNLIGFAGMYTFVYFKNPSSLKSTVGSSSNSTSNSSSSCGPGDALCGSNVRNQINRINGVEVNFISYIQNNAGSS